MRLPKPRCLWIKNKAKKKKLIYIQTELSSESSAERGITSLWVTTPLLGRWQQEAGSREKESHCTDVLKEQLAFSLAWGAEHCSCLLGASGETTCTKDACTAGEIIE